MSDTTVPVVLGVSGAQPTPPATILANLLTAVAAINPGYTALPGTLIEDISSTDVAAIALCDSAFVELINSLTPYGSNAFLLNQLGQIYGVQPNQASNTSVEVLFLGTPGFVIPLGFTVSDGAYQYVAQASVIINSAGAAGVLCVAVQSGSWAVPINTVTQLITSVPTGITLGCNNIVTGTPGTGGQTEESYRADVLRAGLAAAQGMTSFMKTLLRNVPGVQSRLVSVRQQTGGGWEVIVGGGDPYDVANAIFLSLFDISTLAPSIINITGITNANPAVITTDINYGYLNGFSPTISGVTGTSGVNGVHPITVITEKTFSIPVDTTSAGTYTGGGICTPNFRNQTVAVYDFPDVYEILFVAPPQQSVAMTVTWNTSATNYVNPAAVAQAAAPALAAYVNSIAVGQPMNLFEIQATFQAATANLIPTPLLTRMVFSVDINGVGVSPESGTGIIAGDPESYFLTDPTQMTVLQG